MYCGYGVRDTPHWLVFQPEFLSPRIDNADYKDQFPNVNKCFYSFIDLYECPCNVFSGNPAFDQVVQVLFSTSTFVAGLVAVILDNVIQGTHC